MPGERFERFRPGRPDDIGAIAELARHSFPQRDRVGWEACLAENPMITADATWVAEDDGRIVGSCLLLRLTQWISGVRIPTMGLGLVSIAPTHRRTGVGGRMVRAGLRHARDRGDLASALYPFRVGYYGALGYGLAGEAHEYVVPPRALRDDETRARVRQVGSDGDRHAVREVYARAAARETGLLDRTERMWAHILGADDGTAVVYREADGRPTGYAIVRYRMDPPRALEVDERVWLTPAARAALLAWLGSMADQWERIVYRAHPDEHFELALTEPRLLERGGGWKLWFPSATLLRGPMFRLLDVRGALLARRYAHGSPLSVAFAVADPVLAENRTTVSIRIEDGRAAPAVAAQAAVRVTTDISTLSRVFIGDLRHSAAVASGVAAVEPEGAVGDLDAAFELPRPWTFDRF